MSRPIEVTMQAIVGTEPKLHSGATGREFISFRLASTPSIRHADGTWHDGETMWVTAKAWGPFAENIGRSLHKGQPVLATGRLSLETWKREDGEVGVTYVLSLHSIGHDLTRGRSDFLKVVHSGNAGPGASSPSAPSADAAGASAMPEEGATASVARESAPFDAAPSGLAGSADLAGSSFGGNGLAGVSPMNGSSLTETPAGQQAPGNAQWEVVNDEAELEDDQDEPGEQDEPDLQELTPAS